MSSLSPEKSRLIRTLILIGNPDLPFQIHMRTALGTRYLVRNSLHTKRLIERHKIDIETSMLTWPTMIWEISLFTDSRRTSTVPSVISLPANRVKNQRSVRNWTSLSRWKPWYPHGVCKWSWSMQHRRNIVKIKHIHSLGFLLRFSYWAISKPPLGNSPLLLLTWKRKVLADESYYVIDLTVISYGTRITFFHLIRPDMDTSLVLAGVPCSISRLVFS